MLNPLRTISFLVLCFIALAIRAEAATPKIFSTVVNSAQNRITVTGQGFSPTGLAPSVVFATKQVVNAFTDRSVTATLPSGFAVGTYSLTVTNSNSQSAAFDMTLGAAGPMGRPDQPGPSRTGWS
jgi:hypothetical protein